MLDRLWPALLCFAVVTGLCTGRMGEVTEALLQGGQEAIRLGMTLGGAMCVWNGLMTIAEEAGFTRVLARLLRPFFRLLFPHLPPDGEAARAISLNFTANFLGLGNAATPLGLRAMEALRSTMPDKDTAGDEMVTFVVMNTASLQLFPATVVALRSAAGSVEATSILPAVWAASGGTFLLALLAARVFRRPVKGAGT